MKGYSWESTCCICGEGLKSGVIFRDKEKSICYNCLNHIFEDIIINKSVSYFSGFEKILDKKVGEALEEMRKMQSEHKIINDLKARSP